MKFLHVPLTRIVVGISLCILAVAVVQALFQFLPLADAYKKPISAVITGALLIGTYCLLFRFYERRRITEFSTAGLGKSLGLGFLLGALLQSLTILVIYLAGSYTVVSVNSAGFLVSSLIVLLSSALFEEILCRGILFRILEEWLGSYAALAISALIFGALHLGNPNSSLLAALGLAIQAGLLLAAAYMYYRNLWFPIAIHLAWNFMQSSVFGAAVSGNAASRALLSPRIEGHAWITGGAFGPEGSLQATLFCLAVTILLLRLCRREGRIIPYPRRKDVTKLADT